MAETFLTVEEAASRMAVTPYTMREWLKAGKLHGVRVARRWRVPERALNELAGPVKADALAEADAIWKRMTSDKAGEHNAAILELARASEAARQIVKERSHQAAQEYDATSEAEDELADWRALDGEPFHDEAGDYP